jgi:O-methyltransferase involved in polyketide biosynthesis
VVISAAGLDVRPYRLSCLSGVHVYEIDQPSILVFKQSALGAHDLTPNADVHPVAVDPPLMTGRTR